jgi:hypothetical protein
MLAYRPYIFTVYRAYMSVPALYGTALHMRVRLDSWGAAWLVHASNGP